MKIRILLSAVVPAVVSAFVAGCINTATPTEVTKDYLEAARAMDFDKVAFLSGGKMSEEAKKSAEELANLKDSEKYGDRTARKKMAMVAKIEGIFENITYKIEGEKIAGDRAVVDVIVEVQGKAPATTNVYLTKVDGKWKVVKKSDYDQAGCSKAECEKSECKKEDCKKDECRKSGCKKPECGKAECEKAGCKKSDCQKDECRISGCKKPECSRKAECEKAGCKKEDCKKAECEKSGCKKPECNKQVECEKAGCKKDGCKKDECRKSGCKKPECGKAECEKAGCRKGESAK